MKTLLRIAPLALVALPLCSHAQRSTGSAVGLEFPAPPAPGKGHFLAGTYAVGAYSPLTTASGYGYGVQPYLRYQFGSSPTGRRRPFVQYSFVGYRLPAYGTALGYGAENTGLPASPGLAPLAMRNPPYGYSAYGSSFGGLGAFSVGIPMRIGNGSAELSVGGKVLMGVLDAIAW